ncbi:hypothetical protein O6H91_02G005600 [Diphasiastrum complanatum]|uniref:Uncharacterized protein n=1 Tax=Diphasiastrum complanatum TaxID=34168 RepID=A0ACC2ECE8_DIPCM|nr:hypothetical protein O6H91_02G005600 [Diphasiastrum complanatum]
MPGPWEKVNPFRALTRNNHKRPPTVPSRNGHSADGKPCHISPSALSFKNRWNIKFSKNVKRSAPAEKEVQNGKDHKIDFREEDFDLLGDLVMTGMLARPGTTLQANFPGVEVNAKLTSKAFIWALHCLRLDDVVAVSYSDGSRRFTVHSYAFQKTRWVPSTFGKARRRRTDLHFLAPNAEEVLRWATAFAEQGCFVNFSPHPLSSSKKKGSVASAESSPAPAVKCKPRPLVLVILNPRSGRGRARKVFYGKAEPVLKLAGFKMTVVETTHARHAQELAATVDLSTCPDGIICVGGDGIINEVLNGLLNRENTQEAFAVPIGIIPAGSDNSLIWTVMGIKDPISAALTIVKGSMVATDVFALEWTKTGAQHMGLTIAYYGFMSDVLELSAKYQRRFGPLRYFVAGALRLFCLKQYEGDIHYLPVEPPESGLHNGKVQVEPHLDTPISNGGLFSMNGEIEVGSRTISVGMPISDPLYGTARLPVDSDVYSGTLHPLNEPSEYVRGLDGKTKKQASGRVSTGTEEALAVHHSLPGATSPSPRPRTRSKSRIDRSWSGLSIDNDSGRHSRASSGLSGGGGDDFSVSNGIGESMENAIGIRWSPPEADLETKAGIKMEVIGDTGVKDQALQEKWVEKKGPFLGIMICNHQCKTVQCLKSQTLAPVAEHDDGTLDLIIVRAVGRMQLLRFFVSMQFGRHIKLPYVEYKKVRSVVLKPGSNSHQGCGVDGELLMLDGPISASLLPQQCRLIGRSHK